MFNFNQYTKTTGNVCSPSISGVQYEQCLIQVLALPLETQSRNLATPFMNKLAMPNFKSCGEIMPKGCSADDCQYVLTSNPLNELSFKLNLMNASQASDDTHLDSISSNLDSFNPLEEQECVEKASNSMKIKPQDSLPKGAKIYENATVVDMSEEEKVKKGLNGLSFKLLKIRNPETQRTKTKFLCTYKT